MIGYTFEEFKAKLLAELQRIASYSPEFKQNAILITTHCCPTCEALNDTELPIEQAIEIVPIPRADCTRVNGCVCTYATRAVRDENGRLVRKK